MMKKLGLVLQGGGVRGAYTAGVLDYFLFKELYFKYVIGVSAGALNGACYVSKKPGIMRDAMIKLFNDESTVSFKKLF
jgi:predicted patatin/cPLA2 family phospholipase